MHFKTLVTVKFPEIVEDEERNVEIAKKIIELTEMKKEKPDDIMIELALEKLNNVRDTFSQETASRVEDIMYPHYTDLDDPELLEFEDKTDMLREEYENGRPDCVRLPQGDIVEIGGYPVYGRFIIRDGKVYEKYAGPLKHEKRTKSAKRMKALPSYPRKKLYKSFQDYAECYCGFEYCEKYDGYGYFYNPNAMCDWYQVGGRWPAMFLVKENCTEYTIGERSWCNDHTEYKAPEGYIWVCGTRKKHIEWQAMRDWRNQKAAERFHKLEAMFQNRQLTEGFHGYLTEDGIVEWGEQVYKKGETLTEYLSEHGIPDNWKYPLGVHDIVDEEVWMSRDDRVFGEAISWHDRIDDYIDSLCEETVLVGVDYHR